MLVRRQRVERQPTSRMQLDLRRRSRRVEVRHERGEKEPIEDMILSDPSEAWHTPAAERPIAHKGKKPEYAEVDLGDGTKARMKV